MPNFRLSAMNSTEYSEKCGNSAQTACAQMADTARKRPKSSQIDQNRLKLPVIPGKRPKLSEKVSEIPGTFRHSGIA